MGRDGHRCRSSVALMALCACCGLAAASRPGLEVEQVVARVGERVAEYYRRAQSVICVEESTVQPIRSNWSPDGMARTVESERRVESAGTDGDLLPDAKVVREIRRINGRAPRERDSTDRSGCTDPTPLSAVPLAFLLPSGRDEFRFTSVREGREKHRAALIVEFTSADDRSKPVLTQDEWGHADCFDWKGPVATRGRIWVDAATYDVLRVERHLLGPVDVRVPLELQRRYNLDAYVVLDRDDQTVRFASVSFTDPDERLLLPESVESMTVVRGGLQSTRRTETFRDYRRFRTQGRIIKGR